MVLADVVMANLMMAYVAVACLDMACVVMARVPMAVGAVPGCVQMWVAPVYLAGRRGDGHISYGILVMASLDAEAMAILVMAILVMAY